MLWWPSPATKLCTSSLLEAPTVPRVEGGTTYYSITKVVTCSLEKSRKSPLIEYFKRLRKHCRLPSQRAPPSRSSAMIVAIWSSLHEHSPHQDGDVDTLLSSSSASKAPISKVEQCFRAQAQQPLSQARPQWKDACIDLESPTIYRGMLRRPPLYGNRCKSLEMADGLHY